MPQYTAPTFVAGAAVTATDLNSGLSAVSTAFNTLDSTNFNSSTAVPNNSLANPNSVFVATINKDAIAHGAVLTTIQQYFVVPCTCTLKYVAFIGNITDGTEKVDLYKNGTTCLSGPKTIALDDIVYTGTVSTSSFVAGDILTLRAETDAGTEAIANMSVTMAFYATHCSTSLP